jgi:hypothetical protein
MSSLEVYNYYYEFFYSILPAACKGVVRSSFIDMANMKEFLAPCSGDLLLP